MTTSPDPGGWPFRQGNEPAIPPAAADADCPPSFRRLLLTPAAAALVAFSAAAPLLRTFRTCRICHIVRINYRLGTSSSAATSATSTATSFPHRPLLATALLVINGPRREPPNPPPRAID